MALSEMVKKMKEAHSKLTISSHQMNLSVWELEVG